MEDVLMKFDKRLTGLPGSLWQTIAAIDECKGAWRGSLRLHPQILGRLKRSVLITSTGASTRIEGAKLTDLEIEKMLRGIKMQKFADRDQQEVLGYYELLQNVFESWETLSINTSTIKHFHKELLKYVVKDTEHRGEYKKKENQVIMIDQAGDSSAVLFDTTPAYLTAKEMQELLSWTQAAWAAKQLHPLLIIANFIVEFLKIHPFSDGNGRLSRILTNLLMLQADYGFTPYVSQEKIIEDNKPDYYLALRRSQKTFNTAEETILPWLEFFMDVVLKQARTALALLNEENSEKLLSANQSAVLEYLKKNEDSAPGEMSKKLKIPRPTINQILSKLLELKKIKKTGMGRATRYRKVY